MFASKLQSALCCWGSHQQSPPASPTLPGSVSRDQDPIECSCRQHVSSSSLDEKSAHTYSNMDTTTTSSATVCHCHSTSNINTKTNKTNTSDNDAIHEKLPPLTPTSIHRHSTDRSPRTSSTTTSPTASPRISSSNKGYLTNNNGAKPAASRFSLQKYYYPRNRMSMSTSLSPPASPASLSSPGSPPSVSSNTPKPASTSFSRMNSGTGPLPPVAFAGPRTLGLIDSTLAPASVPPSISTTPPMPSTPPLSPPAELWSLTTSSIPEPKTSPPHEHQSPPTTLAPDPLLSNVSLPGTTLPPNPSSLVSPLSPLSPPPSMVTITPSSPPSSPSTAPSFSLSNLSAPSKPPLSLSPLTSPSTSSLSSSLSEINLSLITIASPPKSDLTPYPASGISPASLAALLTRANGSIDKHKLRPLILDLRPNPEFEPLSIVHSININLPTLLMRRYRRGGAVSSFALESFITMPSDKDLYDSIQDSWRSRGAGEDEHHDVIVLDQDMRAGKEEYGRSASPAWTLLNVLERGGGNCGGPLRVWYLEGGFDAFQAWDTGAKFLVYPGSTYDVNLEPQQIQGGTLAIKHEGQLVSTPLSFPSTPAPLSPTTPLSALSEETAQAINNAVSLTTASLGASPGGRRGAPARRESLFSLNTKSLQRPAGLNRAQTIGVSAINIKPLTIPPINQEPVPQAPLRHKASWLTVPTAINTASANSLAGPGAHSPAMSINTHPMDIAQSASTDHTSTWSANSGGSNSGSGNGVDSSQFGPHSLFQSGLTSKRSFSSTTTLSSASHMGPSQGIQEEEEEEDIVPGGHNPNLRRHHSGNSAFSARSTNIMAGGPGGSYFDLSDNKNVGFHDDRKFSDPNHPFSSQMGGDGLAPMNHFGDGYNSSYNNHSAMVNNPPHPYDDDILEEGGDNGEQEISCILPNFLFLGPEIATEEQALELERLGVKRVLNMARECEDALVQNRPGMTYFKIGVQDHIEADVSAGLMQAVEIIAASPDSPIYVHCKAGKSRSVTATIAYLITQLHWPLNKAYNHVLTQRPCMCPNIGFVTELMRMEERTLGMERAGGLVRAGSLNSILSLSTAGSGHTYNNAHHHHHHSLNLGSPKVVSAKNSLSNMSSMSSLTTMAIAPQLH